MKFCCRGLLLLLFVSLPSFADIFILAPKENQGLVSAAIGITAAISDKGVKEDKVHLLSDLDPNSLSIAEDDLILSLGPEAAVFALQHAPNNLVVFTYVEESYIRQLTATRKAGSWAAVVINQPLQRMQKLASYVVQQRAKESILLPVSQENTLLNKQFSELPKEQSALLLFRSFEANARNIARLEDEFYQAGVVLAPLDSQLWRGKNARLLLHQAYNYRVPVIAHSRAFTKAGAMLALYLSKDAVAKEAADLAYVWLAAKSLGQDTVIYPAARLDVNDNIARALKFEPATIKQHVENNKGQDSILGRLSHAR